ncbi:MAG TPA: hypothetical protein V6D17_13175 [Candidatus Obscuribacterales bacterium]
MDEDYGLALTNNSKASWAFSLPRSKTCIMATSVCKKLCYGNGIRYQSAPQKEKRERNYRTVKLLLQNGGPPLLAENLVALIDQARPSDWLAASVTGRKTKTPWTIRIHDTGDFDADSEYVEAWRLAMIERPHCSFWFYTRSFREQRLFDALTQLASLPNCQGWLSIDSENYSAGLLAYAQHPEVWKLAFLQEDQESLDKDLLPQVAAAGKSKDIVSFPYHRGGYHVEPIHQSGVFTCPAVLGVYKLEANASNVRPCQACSFCLPHK